MDGIDFAVGGPEGFEAYDYIQASEEEISFFPQEPSYDASVTTAMKSLGERVQQNHTHTHTLSTIDNVVKVKTLNAQVRAQKVDFWKSRRAEMWTLGGAGLIGVIGAGFLMGSSPAVAGILGICSLACSILGFYRGSQASSQITNWSLDVPVAIANQRKVAFEEGLIHVMRQDESDRAHPVLYSTIMTTTELQGLYNVYFHNLARAFERGGDVKEQLSVIKQVAVNGPLCPHVYAYAKLHPHYVQQLTFYINEHDKFVHAYDSIEKRRIEQEKQVKNSAYEQICGIEKQKDAALFVVNETYNEYKKQIETERSEALFALAGDKEREGVVLREFDQKLSDARQLRDLGRAAISYPFDVQRQNVEKERDGYINQIRRDRDAQLLPFYSHLSLLHTNAYRALIGKPPSAYPTLSDPYTLSFHPPVFTMPAPSAPPFEAAFGGVRDQHRVNDRVYDEFMNVFSRQQYTH